MKRIIQFRISHSALEGIRSHPSGPAARVGFPSLQRAQIVQPACLEPVAPQVLCMGNPRDVIYFIFSSTTHNAVLPGSGTPSPLLDVSAFTT